MNDAERRRVRDTAKWAIIAAAVVEAVVVVVFIWKSTR